MKKKDLSYDLKYKLNKYILEMAGKDVVEVVIESVIVEVVEVVVEAAVAI